MPLSPSRNVVLIGMPGVGKSTVGVLLAKATGRQFLDTDVHMQAREGRRLQEILNAEGLEGFLRIEAAHVLSLTCANHVLATGGSVPYVDEAMEHLARSGVVVHLDLAPEILERRLADLNVRGVVIGPGRTIRDLYEERTPLYRRWADLTLACGEKTQDEVVAELIDKLKSRSTHGAPAVASEGAPA